jgi:hypothetical protein
MVEQANRNQRRTRVSESEQESTRGSSSYLRSGIVAGTASVLVFTVVHDLFISDIWDMLIIMTVAGAVCGLCIGWTYRRLFDAPSIGNWLGYNLVYLVMFGLLGATSLIVFEPVTTLAEIIEEEGPIDELIGMALPMTVLFALATVAAISVLFVQRWTDIGPVFLTVTVLVLFLGLNVSAIGLVEIPRDSMYLVAELFGLILVINVAFAATFVALEWESLTARSAQSKQHDPTQIT